MKVEQKLLDYKNTSDLVNAPHREDRLLELLEYDQVLAKTKHPKRQRLQNYLDFALGQFCIFGRMSFLWALLWLGVFAFAMRYRHSLFGTGLVMPIISALSPLLLILVSVDMGKVTNRSLLEIEACTKYSIGQVLIFRLLVHELLQVVLLFIACLLGSRLSGESLLRILLYGYTPLIISGAVFLLCISHFTGAALQYAGVSIAGITVCTLLTLAMLNDRTGSFLHIFAEQYLLWWKLALAAGLLLYGTELVRIKRKVRKDGIRIMLSC